MGQLKVGWEHALDEGSCNFRGADSKASGDNAAIASFASEEVPAVEAMNGT